MPVKLLWSREEDMRQGRFHPVTQCKLVGGFDANNNLTGLHMRIAGQSILAAVRPEAMVKGMDPATFQGLARSGEFEFGYAGIPNLLIDHAMRNPHVPPGFWRGVNINQNAIYIECFMDELAAEAKQDPLEFRRKLMAKNPKHLAVLNAVAERAGWGKPPPKGIFRGLAQMKAFNSFVAACAEVSVTGGNKVKVHRIICATDPGYAVNPAQIERQIAGLVCVWAVGIVRSGMHGQKRPYRTREFQHLPQHENRANAEGRIDRHAVRRILGRRGRADDLCRRACGAERDCRCNRQTLPPRAAEEPRSHAGVTAQETRLTVAQARYGKYLF